MDRHGTKSYELGRTFKEPLLTVGDVCEVLAISKHVLYRLLRAGELSPSRVGGRLRFESQDVRAYLDRHREAVGSG